MLVLPKATSSMCAASSDWHCDCHDCLFCVCRRMQHSCWSIDMAESMSEMHLRALDGMRLIWQSLFLVCLRQTLMRWPEARMGTCRERDHDRSEPSLESACGLGKASFPTLATTTGASLLPSSLRFASALQRIRRREQCLCFNMRHLFLSPYPCGQAPCSLFGTKTRLVL